jgi:predicted RNA binding protein YcfA (HicA-like mRNA interferase family)
MPKLSAVSWKRLAKTLEAAGWTCTRIEGDHMTFTKPGAIRPVVIPRFDPVPVFIIRNNLRAAGISRDGYLAPLAKR